MADHKSRRDRRKAKASNYAREPKTSMSANRVGHGPNGATGLQKGMASVKKEDPGVQAAIDYIRNENKRRAASRRLEEKIGSAIKATVLKTPGPIGESMNIPMPMERQPSKTI